MLQVGGQRANKAIALHRRVIGFELPQRARQRLEQRPPALASAQNPRQRLVQPITAEQFVAAQTCQHDLDLLRRFFRQQQKRNGGRIGVRLVVGVNVLLKSTPPVSSSDDALVVVGFEMLAIRRACRSSLSCEGIS